MKRLALFTVIVALFCLCATMVWADTPKPEATPAPTVAASVAPASTKVASDTQVSTIPKPKSTGFSFGPNGVSITYLHDNHDYGLAAGAEIGRKNKLVAQGWVVFEPTNKSQIGLAVTMGYDIGLSKDVTLTPLVGVMQPVTEGLDGTANGKFVYGGSLAFKF